MNQDIYYTIQGDKLQKEYINKDENIDLFIYRINTREKLKEDINKETLLQVILNKKKYNCKYNDKIEKLISNLI